MSMNSFNAMQRTNSSSSSEYEDIIEDIVTDIHNKYYSVMENSRTLLDKAETDYTISLILVEKEVRLNKNSHLHYLLYFLLSNRKLPTNFSQLEASNPWILYWLINSLKVIKFSSDDVDLPMSIEQLNSLLTKEVFLKLNKFQRNDFKGVFAGGYSQLPHLATNYSSVLALLLTDNLDEVDCSHICKWFKSLLVTSDDEHFKVKTSQICGERDSRSLYCLLVVAKLLKIDLDIDFVEKLWRLAIDLQSDLEGGLTGVFRTDESHGGYAYCSLSSLVILLEILWNKKPETYKNKKLHDFINVDNFIEWLSRRQDYSNGGLNGRNNKLVDGCYAFWIGACGSILEIYGYVNPINMSRLKDYILFYCQENKDKEPGLRDKPGKNSDFYHTNYVLLGLSLCEYSKQLCLEDSDSLKVTCMAFSEDHSKDVYPINPIYAVPLYTLKSLNSKD